MTSSAVATSARDRLLQVADRLFYARGIRAVGIKEIVDEAAVAKTSLYLHFASKDELVVAYLEGRVTEYLAAWQAILDGCAHESPDSRLDVVFYTLRDFAEATGFRGCPFVNAAAELFDPGHPGHAPIARYRRFVRDGLFGQITRAAGVPDPDAVAARFQVLYDGALAGAMIENGSGPVDRARAISHVVLAAVLDRTLEPR
jgi:AcrR family transcriptional regulator